MSGTERVGMCNFGSSQEKHYSHSHSNSVLWHSRLFAFPTVCHVPPSSSGPLHMLFPSPGILLPHFLICLANTIISIFRSQLKFQINLESHLWSNYLSTIWVKCFLLSLLVAYLFFPYLFAKMRVVFDEESSNCILIVQLLLSACKVHDLFLCFHCPV